MIENVFGCLDDIFELTNRFLSDLEDAKDMRDDLTKNISLYEPFQNFIEVVQFIHHIENSFVYHREMNLNVIQNILKQFFRLNMQNI